MTGRTYLLYLHARADQEYCQVLEDHLSSLRQEGLLRDWGERSLVAGDEVQARLQSEIARADVVVLLVSADFLAAERSQAQIDLVLAELDKRPLLIIPVLVRAVDWRRGRLGRFYALPRNGKPVATWDRTDDAWFDVTEGLRRLIQKNAAASGCPFPGLEFFDEVQAPLFVGREAELREALAGLGQTADGYRRWLQIEGASGAGKSSFARAGLLPAIRCGGPKGSSPDWLIGVLRPGREPLANLARALIDALAPVKTLAVSEVAAQLRAGSDALKDLLLADAPPRCGVLLVVDQLEELFTLSEEQSTEVACFDSLLARALAAGDSPLHLLTTVRTDFLGHMSRLPELEATMNRASRYYLRPIKQARLREALAELAHRADIIWEGGLLDRLVADAGDEDGVLPLVGHALRALWAQRVSDTLTNAAYEAIQGVAGALSASADGLLASLDAKQRPLARALLLALVKIGRGAADTRRVVLRPEALHAAGGGPEAEQILARLSGGRNPEAPPAAASPPRLVVVSGSTDQPSVQRVDLAHEAVLRRWTTLRDWIEADRKVLERRDDLESAIQSWEAAGRPEDGLPHGAQLSYFQQVPKVLLSLRAQNFVSRAERLAGWRRKELRAKPRVMLRYMAAFSVAISVISSIVFYSRQLSFIERDWRQRAMILLGYLANQAQFGAYSGDRALLTYPVQRLADEEDVVYVVVYDTHGRQVIKTNSRLSGQPPPNPSPVFLSEALREANKDAERLTGQPHGLLAEGAARRFWQYKNEAFNCTDLYTAIVLPDRGGPETAAFVSPTDPVTRDRVVGLVRIGMSLDPSANRLREVVRWSFLLGVGILLFGILVSVLISRRLARPIAAFSDREFANLRAT